MFQFELVIMIKRGLQFLGHFVTIFSKIKQIYHLMMFIVDNFPFAQIEPLN